MDMRIKPLRDRMVAEKIEDDDMTAGGIYMPDSARERPQRAKVLAVGEGKVNDDGKVLPMQVRVGDEVIFGKYSYSEVSVDGKEYLMLREDEVWGVIQKGGEQHAG